MLVAPEAPGPRHARLDLVEDEERADPWIPRLVDALGACKDPVTASALRGAAMKGTGRREEAGREFAAALDALEDKDQTGGRPTARSSAGSVAVGPAGSARPFASMTRS